MRCSAESALALAFAILLWPIILFALAFGTAAAHADTMDVAVTDDFTLVQDLPPGRDIALEQMRDAGVTTIRTIVWKGEDLSGVDAMVSAARAAGMDVYLTLADPDADWMVNVARRYGDQLSYIGIVDEPDLTMVNPSRPACTHEKDITRVLRAAGLTTTHRRVRVHLIYHGHVRKVHRNHRVAYHGTVHRHVVRLTRKRLVRRRGHARRYIIRYYYTARRTRLVVVRTAEQTGREATYLADEVCMMMLTGRRYREFVLEVAPRLRAVAPNAKLLAGETSPCLPPVIYLMSAATQGGLQVDGWAHHPYQWSDPYTSTGGTGLGDLPRVRDHIDGLPLYLTEFGYMRTDYVGIRFSPDDMARLIPRAFAVARDNGARMLSWQGWSAPPSNWTGLWDTGLGVGQADAPLSAFRTAAMGS